MTHKSNPWTFLGIFKSSQRKLLDPVYVIDSDRSYLISLRAVGVHDITLVPFVSMQASISDLGLDLDLQQL